MERPIESCRLAAIPPIFSHLRPLDPSRRYRDSAFSGGSHLVRDRPRSPWFSNLDLLDPCTIDALAGEAGQPERQEERASKKRLKLVVFSFSVS